MARYVATISTARTPDEVFDFMADFRNVATWDRSVRRIEQVDGDGAGPGAEYDVTIARPGRDLTLRYRTVGYEPTSSLRFVASDRLITSDDRITVDTANGSTRLVYDARLRLNGPLRLADPLLGPVFQRFASRAAAELRDALDGTDVG